MLAAAVLAAAANLAIDTHQLQGHAAVAARRRGRGRRDQRDHAHGRPAGVEAFIAAPSAFSRRV